MDQRNGKTKIMTIGIVLVALSCLFAGYSLYTQYHSYQNQLIIVDELTESLDNLKQQADDIKNIDKKIEEAKEDYYNSIVQLEKDIKNNKSDKKIAYITIDDGPYELTHEFLEVLEEHDVKATFFTLMKPDRRHIYEKILSKGHNIGNHTASHTLGQGGIYSSTSRFVNDIRTLEKWLQDELNYTPTLFRFPGGAATSGNLKEPIVNALKDDYKYVEWNVDVGDGSTVLMENGRPYEYFLSQIDKQNVAVILMHDYSEKTIEDLPKMIEYLKNNGYMILPLTNRSTAVY